MYTAEEIKADSAVKELFSKYHGVTEEANRAVEQLVKKQDGLRSMRKIVPALRERKLNVFLSYKKKDRESARIIVDILRENSAGKLNITYMEDFGEEIGGRKWRQKIRNEVVLANWFILLLPDPSEDWDWCLYETGLFDSQPTSSDRLICLHHPNSKIPSAISEYQAYSARQEDMEKFLKMVFVRKNAIPGMNPINKHISKKIPDIATQLVEAIQPPKVDIEHIVYEPHLKLIVEDPKNLESKEDLDAAIIEEINREALDIFDRDVAPATFGELREGIKEPTASGRWREELVAVIRKIADGRRFKPVQAVFNTLDEKIYRPVAHAVDRTVNGEKIQSFHITFSEEVGALDTSNMPDHFASLATMLRLAFRFRWEILEKFGKGHLDESDLESLENVLQRLEQDAESRGVDREENADLSFFNADEQRRISDMYKVWYGFRDRINGTGDLDIALRDKDTNEISVILGRMIPLNQDFLEIAANRFSEMVAEKV